MKHWYIVYFEEFSSYGRAQGGYYVKYKDKCSDVFSESSFLAKKYKNISGAINRLGINTLDGKVSSMDKFWDINSINLEFKRSKNLNKILNCTEDIPNDIPIFKRGKIERIYEDGSIKLANKDVINYIKEMVEKNKKKRKNFEKKHKYIFEKNKNIVDHNPEEDFWEGF